MIINALADKPLPVYGDGLNVRDWLYVEDHCKAIDLIIHNGKIGEVYNVGGHNEMANIDIVKLILKKLSKPETLITFVEDRKGHDRRYAIDPTKIHNELGWLPDTKFADGIEKCIPGMVAGGPNGRPADPYAVEVIKPGTPPMKCYADDAASYSLNEITIYWNSPAVFVRGYLCR